MDHSTHVKNTLLKKCLALLVVAFFTESAKSQCEYDVEIIGGPECELADSSMQGKAINEAGIVAAELSICFGPNNTAIWDGGPTYTLLPKPPGMSQATPMDISNTGGVGGAVLIAGTGAFNGPTRAFVHDGTGFINLGTLPGTAQSWGEGVGDDGVVVGYAFSATGGAHSGFRWQNGVMEPITLPVQEDSRVFARNEAGDVAGWYSAFNGTNYFQQPFILTHDGQFILLPVLPNTTTAVVEAMNEDRVVAGRLTIEQGQNDSRVPVYWRNGEVRTLPILQPYVAGLLRDVNNANVMVGYCDTTGGGSRPTVWYHGEVYNFRELVTPSPQYTMVHCWSVNNAGQITGAAFDDIASELVAFRATPSKRITGDTNCDREIGITDLLHVIGDWSVPGGPSDVNFDRIVSLPDLIEVITRWGIVSK